jgi:radical SAM-linked protein
MAALNQPYQQRLRVTFAKGEAIKYIGHLDLAKAWERALRRAGLPLAYSLGFHPQARLAFASALPLGVTGDAELLDVFLETPVTPEDFVRRLRPVLPVGLEIKSVQEVELRSPSLQSLLRFSDYRVELPGDLPPQEIEGRVAGLLGAEKLPRQRERRGRREEYDLRPLVENLALTGQRTSEVSETSEVCRSYILEMRLRSDAQATGRPAEVLEALGLPPAIPVRRTGLVLAKF